MPFMQLNMPTVLPMTLQTIGATAICAHGSIPTNPPDL